MRVTTLLIGFTVAAAACDGKPLTGPDAQRAVAQASGMFARLPKDLLVVVDGKRLESDKKLKDIDPASIETVEVLKGKAAAKVYGDDGAHGVIVVTTKHAPR